MRYFFLLYQSPSLSLNMVFDSASTNMDEVFLINLSANVFVFGDFNIHHKDLLNYSGGTNRSSELFYNFCISNDLTHMVNFPTRIPDCDLHSPALLVFFLSSDVSICSTMAFHSLGNSDHVGGLAKFAPPPGGLNLLSNFQKRGGGLDRTPGGGLLEKRGVS